MLHWSFLTAQRTWLLLFTMVALVVSVVWVGHVSAQDANNGRPAAGGQSTVGQSVDGATPDVAKGEKQGPADGSEEGAGRFNWPSAWAPDVNKRGAAGNRTGTSRTADPAAAPLAPPAPAKPQLARPPTPAVDTVQAAPVDEKPDGAANNSVSGDQAEPEPVAPQQPAAEEAVPPIELKKPVLKDIQTAKGLSTRLDSVEKAIERLRERDEELTQRLPTIELILSEGSSVGDRLKQELGSIKSLIERLGPAPEEGKTEAEGVATGRKRLDAALKEVDGAIKITELTQVRGRQLITRVQELRLENFRRGLFARSPSLLTPGIWSEAVTALPAAGRQIETIFAEWFARAIDFPAYLAMLAGLTMLVGFGSELASRRIRRLIRSRAGQGETPFSRRAMFAGLNAPLRMLPKIIAAVIVYAGLDAKGLLYLQVGEIAVAALKAIVVIAAGLAFTTAYLQPARHNWRVVDLGDPAAWQVRRLLRAAIWIFGIDLFVRSVIGSLYLPLSVNIVWTGLAALAFAGVFIQVIRTDIATPAASTQRLAFLAGRLHKVPLVVLTAAILIAAVTGYVALAHFLATGLLNIGGAVFLLVIFYLANRAIAQESVENSETLAGAELFMPLEVRKRVGRGLSILLDIVLFLLAIPFVLLAVGFAATEISTLTNRALFGFEIGGVEISLARIGLALALFGGIIFASRMAQRWLGETILHPSRTEQGLGNSIRTGVGYLGFIVAALVGLSYAGLDITNLAIVAGALSVGIGFGLQSIVNNFVSGLILLVERPINVGDWIKVGTLEGRVRKISVRSTELETFDRASVIIPNSEFISGTVTNMTLRNALGRITIPIGVSYNSDPEQVSALLLESAKECELVARYPEPFVVFEDFGASSLDFSLRIFVADVGSSLSTKTAVRKLIIAKFREAGIEIPFPQQDLHLRDLDSLKSAMGRAMAERAASAAQEFMARQENPAGEKDSAGGAAGPKGDEGGASSGGPATSGDRQGNGG